MKWLFLFLAMTTVAAAQQPGVSCTYDSTDGTVISYCTMPDGSGVETHTSDNHVSEEHYTPREWTIHLNAVAKAAEKRDKKRTAVATALEEKTAREDAYRKRIHGSKNKKECRANGGVWYLRMCNTQGEYAEDSVNPRECAKRGGIWGSPTSSPSTASDCWSREDYFDEIGTAGLCTVDGGVWSPFTQQCTPKPTKEVR